MVAALPVTTATTAVLLAAATPAKAEARGEMEEPADMGFGLSECSPKTKLFSLYA